ncbi:hypothetical protein [Streptomyces sp. NPDC046909]|uniref:tyrosine-protein kinase family protein n=1 Tax=Streptomyces sp. NPDC046909 TaxID=3155617 RepID=UPI0033E7A525
MEPGQIVTFYSYKGGVGRSFALANTAVVLARWGYRVLCVDWDLEAPGLGHYFEEHIAESRSGLLEMIEEARESPFQGRSAALGHLTTVTLPEGARLDLITAGKKDDPTYVSRLQGLDWQTLYTQHRFGRTLEAWREEWMERYDLVLVDSRTGVTDSGGICTVQIPDVLVFVFTANEQNVSGVLEVVEMARKERDKLQYDRPGLLTVPLLSRFDAQPEYERGETWRRKLAERMEPRLRDWAPRGGAADELLQRVTVPYFPVWSFGEPLPALTESHRNSAQVTYSISSLAALLARRLEDVGLLIENRDSYVETAQRAAQQDYEADVFVSQSPRTAAVAGQFVAHLHEHGLTALTVAGDPLSTSHEQRRQLIDRCRHFVLLVGDGGESVAQRLDMTYFLRQSVNVITAERRVLPVVTSASAVRRLPPLTQSLEAFNLEEVTLVQAARAISDRVRQAAPLLEYGAPRAPRAARYDI